MQVSEQQLGPEEVIRRGKEIYARVIKPRLKKEDDWKWVDVDVISEDYEMDHDGIAVTDRLRKRRPHGVFWGGRVGEPAAYRMGWSGPHESPP
jgi:hypothetical protein